VPSAIEKEGGCPLRFTALTKDTPKHSWGYVDFQTPDASMPAAIYCDGNVVQSDGVSICQSKKGLTQEIKFHSEVKVSKATSCDFDSKNDIDKNFRYTMPEGECVFVFRETSGQRRFHRLTTIGYDQIILKDK
jgi:hypothetical protein